MWASGCCIPGFAGFGFAELRFLLNFRFTGFRFVYFKLPILRISLFWFVGFDLRFMFDFQAWVFQILVV